jgi:hypothetical protein
MHNDELAAEQGSRSVSSMLFRAHVALHLPHELGEAVPTDPADAILRLLLDGDRHRRMATTRATAAGVLAGLFAAVRDVGGHTIRVRDDAEAWIDLPVAPERMGDAPDPWPRDLPRAWTEEPIAFELEATVEQTALQGRLALRHTPRHDPAQGAVTGSVTMAWRPAELDVLDDSQSQRALAAIDLQVVAARLRDAGRRSAEQLAQALSHRFDGAPAAQRGDVIVLVPDGDDPDRRFGTILRGLDVTARAVTWALSRRAFAESRTWSAVDPSGTHGRAGGGRFVPGRDDEATHAL